MEQIADGGGLRYNEGKIPLELIPPEVELALGRALLSGSKKYGLRNWERGMSWMTVVGCLKRHLNKFLLGEDVDTETGRTSLELVLINAAFLVTYEARGIGTDDRPKIAAKENK